MKLISQLSRDTRIPVATIRFYQKSGLIRGEAKTQVSSNNYQYYGEEVAEKLRFIQMAKAVGFTLSEIREVVDAWYRKEFTKTAKLAVLDKKLVQIDQQMQQLKAMRKQIAVCKHNIENDIS